MDTFDVVVFVLFSLFIGIAAFFYIVGKLLDRSVDNREKDAEETLKRRKELLGG